VLLLFARLEEMPTRVFSYDEVKPVLENYLMQEKFNTAYNEWISDLISKSFVRIIPR